MSTTCTVTGRVHRSASEKASELAYLGAEIDHVQDAIAALHLLVGAGTRPGRPDDQIGDACNLLNDVLDTLLRQREAAEDNPRPCPPGYEASWRLAFENRD